MAYDFTVLAGTQGHLNHRKKDRMFEMARNFRLPLVLFAEGGGGRPGDTDGDFSSRTSTTSPRSAAWCRWSESSRAAASPATRRCWDAAT